MMNPLFSNEKSDERQRLFQLLKPSCVPLLEYALLTPSNVPIVLRHLKQLLTTLRTVSDPASQLSPNLVSYIFFPLSHILRRNDISTTPDSVLENIMHILAILCASWWWYCDVQVWNQLVVLLSSVIAESSPTGSSDPQMHNKKFIKEEETKVAALHCFLVLLRRRTIEEAPSQFDFDAEQVSQRCSLFVEESRSVSCIPIIGSVLSATLNLCVSPNRSLQRNSLHIVCRLIDDYIHEDMAPAVVPGVVSAMTKCALGVNGKGWVAGEVVCDAMGILKSIIVKAMSDDTCVRCGIIVEPKDLDDLVISPTIPRDTQDPPMASIAAPVQRTVTWLRGTATQLHIALNSLTTLVRHPNHLARLSLSTLWAELLTTTRLSLPQSRTLFLSGLLSFALDESDTVRTSTRNTLARILDNQTPGGSNLQRELYAIARGNLGGLPHLIRLRADVKVQFLSRQVDAICSIVLSDHKSANRFCDLLGPTGGVEKWALSFLSVLDFDIPRVIPGTDSFGRAQIAETMAILTPFPEMAISSLSDPQTRTAVESMLRSLGRAAGEQGFYAIEWFIRIGQSGNKSLRVSALWCAARLLEGLADVDLDSEKSFRKTAISLDVERVSRSLTRNLTESWDYLEEDLDRLQQASELKEPDPHDVALVNIEHVKGLRRLQTKLDIVDNMRQEKSAEVLSRKNWILKQALSLHVLTILSAILGSRFSPLLLHALYPIMHAAVSPVPFISVTGLAALQHVSHNAAYASAANCLLANFDYVLDGVSQRLTRRQLDVDVTKVLVLLVNLVGKELISRAGDVVEECFDRLDDFHGYEIVVEGLVEVLNAVTNVIAEEWDEHMDRHHEKFKNVAKLHSDYNALERWFRTRVDQVSVEKEDFGPVPQTAWGSSSADDSAPNLGAGNVSEGDGEDTSKQEIWKLVSQVTERSIPFLTHPSPLIRSRILKVLTSAAPLLPDTSLLPAVHKAWPYVLNRLADTQPYVISAAAMYIEALGQVAGSFMVGRIWQDVWPRFRKLFEELERVDLESSLVRRTEKGRSHSAYSTSHRLYTAVLRTLDDALAYTTVPHETLWEVVIFCRRFLDSSAHVALQNMAVKLYSSLRRISDDTVWLVLHATQASQISEREREQFTSLTFMKRNWDIQDNMNLIFS